MKLELTGPHVYAVCCDFPFLVASFPIFIKPSFTKTGILNWEFKRLDSDIFMLFFFPFLFFLVVLARSFKATLYFASARCILK